MAKILVVDDEDGIRSALRRALTLDDHEVLLASDGVEGERLFRENQPDLMITDIIMPGKEGIDLLKELLAEFPDRKIIVMSGGARVVDGDDLQFLLDVAQSAGARRAIKKPFDLDELRSIVHDMLKGV